MKQFKFKIAGQPYDVSVEERENNIAEVVVNGVSYTVALEEEQTSTPAQPVVVAAAVAAPVAGATATGQSTVITAPLPGSIFKIPVANGQLVRKNDVLLIMESMKMENNILAEADGVVKNLFVSVGQSVMQGDKLVEVSGVAAAPQTPVTPVHTAPVASPAAPAPAVAPPVATPAGKGAPVKAALPGSIVKLLVKEGQQVKNGDVLLTMESMKMENEITSEKDGVVVKILVAPGQAVLQDDILLELA
ncbi:MAG: biotin/lipoyl-binding protein [Prevotellaceae bacterium]|jgi:biotin carboxyl carrier protein|nr:biotin/lipoyl-binding protein [Prevotellaceae bacterium]